MERPKPTEEQLAKLPEPTKPPEAPVPEAVKAPEPVKPFEYKTMEEIDEARIPIEKLSREELGKAAENIGKEGEAANLSYESSKTKLDADKEATDYASKLREGLFHEKVTRFRKDKEGVLQPFETTQISKDAPPEAWGMLTGEKGNIADLFTKYPSIKKNFKKQQTSGIWQETRGVVQLLWMCRRIKCYNPVTTGHRKMLRILFKTD
jgi:hypothetical protein